MKIYAVKNENNEVLNFIYEESANAQALVLNAEVKAVNVKKQIFENMLEEMVFQDMEKYLNENHSINEDESENESEKVQSQIAELMAMVEELKSENAKLKTTRPRLSLEDAVKLHEQKNKLEKNKIAFENARDFINSSLVTISGVNDFDENSNYKLVCVEFNHTTKKEHLIFSIATNGVIMEVLQEVNSKVNSKISEINMNISDIEKMYL